MLDITSRRDDELWWMIGAPVQLLQRTNPEVPNGIARAEDRMAVGVRTPQHLVVQLEHEVVGRVLDHRDLLEDDFPLEGEIARAQ